MANPSIVGAIAAMAQEYLVGGWPTPLKNDGVRQLGLWNSQYDGKNKKMFQTTNQIWYWRVIGVIDPN